MAVQVAAIPFNPSGTRLEVYGRNGAMVISAPRAFNIGPNLLYASQGGNPLAEMPVPDKYVVAPEGTPAGSPRNVAQAYARAADALNDGGFEVDFDLAVTRHRLIDAMERSSNENRTIKL